MIQPLHDVICQAIRNKHLLAVRHKRCDRVVQPSVLYATRDGHLVLHAWQVEGHAEQTSLPAWCDLPLADMTVVTPLYRTCVPPQPTDTPPRPHDHQVICGGDLACFSSGTQAVVMDPLGQARGVW